jgi:anti-sigma B factor antagonist
LPSEQTPSQARGDKSAGELDITIHTEGACWTVCLAGELDIASVPELEAELTQILEDAGEIVLDIEAVNFVDSSGIRVILQLERTCEERGIRFVRTPGQTQAQRVFDMTGVSEQLPVTHEPTACD